MIFNSLEFLLFFPIIFIIYYSIPFKARNLFLLVSSYYFYSCWDVSYVGLMLISTVITYFSGILIGGTLNVNKKKIYLVISLVANIGILFYFKYYNFLSYSFQYIFSWIDIELAIPNHDFILPVGISFYTFQALSYSIDMYNNKIPPENNFIRYALFVSFFPQLVAGPIEKSKDLLPQFKKKIAFSYDMFKSGMLLILWGLFKKLVIADRLAIFVDDVYDNPSEGNGLILIVATLFYSIQIYCDFSGYTDIAIGVARALGFKLSKNFDTPYFSKNIPEFWRRWHITLGAWFKEYVYFPLGGNRGSRLNMYKNLFIVFAVSGLWHGASWNFVLWGIWHGMYVVLYLGTKKWRDRLVVFLRIDRNSYGHKITQIGVTYFLVCIGWVFFRAKTFVDTKIIFEKIIDTTIWPLFSGELFKHGLNDYEVFNTILMILIMIGLEHINRTKSVVSIINKQAIIYRWSVYFAVIITILLFGVYGDYDASRFIYFQF